MKRIALLATLVVLLGTGSAEAKTTIVSPNPVYQQWVDQAKVPTPSVILTIIEAECPVQSSPPPVACAMGDTVWLDPAQMDWETRRVVYRRLGYIYRRGVLPDWAWDRFLSLIYTPAGEEEVYFAEVYAECAFKPYISARWRAGVGQMFGADPIGGARAHNRVCRMLARFG